MKRLEKIRLAYEGAQRHMPEYFPKLPKWEDLPTEMREAIVHVYGVGRIDLIREERDERLKKEKA
jgi:hypothetical protein